VSFLRFYQAFLDWRSLNHWDNRTASNLTALFHSECLVDVANHPSDELVRRADPEFLDPYASAIWLYVIQTVGPNLVEAGFLEESARLRADEDYGIYVRDAPATKTFDVDSGGMGIALSAATLRPIRRRCSSESGGASAGVLSTGWHCSGALLGCRGFVHSRIALSVCASCG
jgi:hypothetical protein